MGAPSAPAAPPPTKDEVQAVQAAADQKKAALVKIRQDVFARSQGLRGAASLYDFAGPTPGMAGNPAAGYKIPGATAKPAARAAPGPSSTTHPNTMQAPPGDRYVTPGTTPLTTNQLRIQSIFQSPTLGGAGTAPVPITPAQTKLGGIVKPPNILQPNRSGGQR